MKLSRNQKRYAGILGACLLALGIDRVFLAPGEAKANPDDESVIKDHLADRGKTGIEAPTRNAAVPETTLATQFEAIAEERQLDPTNVPNAFRSPPWVDVEAPQIVERDDPRIQEFLASHRLTGVMAIGEGGYAIVDGKRLRLGEKVDGFELVTIGKRSITLKSGPYEVELTLATPSIQGGG